MNRFPPSIEEQRCQEQWLRLKRANRLPTKVAWLFGLQFGLLALLSVMAGWAWIS